MTNPVCVRCASPEADFALHDGPVCAPCWGAVYGALLNRILMELS